MPDISTLRGSYGLRLFGVDSIRHLASSANDPGWPAVDVRQIGAIPSAGPDRIGRSSADIGMLGGGRALVDRSAGTATYVCHEERADGRIVHPFMTTVGTVFAWWLGRQAFHGGGFLAGGGAWGVLGDREAGKSSLLAALSLAGRTIISDDLLVVADRTTFAGPRCIDLRRGAAEALGIAAQTDVVRGGQRFRLPQAPAAAETPLCGWIFPAWGARLELQPLSPSQRLALLAAYRCVPSDNGSGLMNLVTLPAWRLVRPRSWASMEAAVERLLALTDA